MSERNEKKLPEFRYHPDPLRTGAFQQGKARRCGCCGEETEIWYEGPFYTAEDEIECLCPGCIHSGAAAEKFNGEFQDSGNLDEVSDEKKLDELICRTPGYSAWQQGYWPAHCDDYCAFDGYVGWEELVKMGIEQEIEENYSEELNGIPLEEVRKYLLNNGSMQGYLFRCLHCGRHILYVDCD